MSPLTKFGPNVMKMISNDEAPSPEQPLSGQGVRRIPRFPADNVDDHGKCPPTTISIAPPLLMTPFA